MRTIRLDRCKFFARDSAYGLQILENGCKVNVKSAYIRSGIMNGAGGKTPFFYEITMWKDTAK